MTLFFQVGRGGWEPDIFSEAVKVVRGGGLVIFPTETVYGLGGNANNQATVEKIYRLKGRKGDKPLTRLIADREDIYPLIEDEGHRRLLEERWPGPLTVICTIPGGGTRGYRLPEHDSLRRLIRESGVEMAATSANRSGEPAITDGKEAARQFLDRVDVIIDEGEVSGRASTVLDLTVQPERILRLGPVTREEIEACLGRTIKTTVPPRH